MAIEGGPYVQAACFCDVVLEGKDNVVSLIRIIDTITRTEQVPEVPDAMPDFTMPMTMVLMLKSGKALGRHNLRIVPELPSGETLDPQTQAIHFSGEETGQNVIMRTRFTFQLEGLYWFWIYMDDDTLLAALPLRVKYNPICVSST